MITREQIKKELNSYNKEQLIEALLQSTAATAFTLSKCKALYGVKPIKEEKVEETKEAEEVKTDGVEAGEVKEPVDAKISPKKAKNK